jgi:hypothetical protein
MADTTRRNPILAACQQCKHVWPILWTPCDSGMLGKVTSLFCPMCGEANPGSIHLASREAGDLDRYAAWLEAELIRALEDASHG